jgi:hypothetical protein
MVDKLFTKDKLHQLGGLMTHGRVTPHGGEKVCGLIFSDMKTKLNPGLMPSELVTAAYQAWLARRAGKLVRPSGKARPLALPLYSNSAAKGWSV